MAVYGDGNHWTPFLQKNTGVNNTLGNYQSALAAALAAQRNAQNQGGGDFLSHLSALQGMRFAPTISKMSSRFGGGDFLSPLALSQLMAVKDTPLGLFLK